MLAALAQRTHACRELFNGKCGKFVKDEWIRLDGETGRSGGV